MADLDIQKKLDVLALVEQLGNVISEAAKISGVFCDTIYRHRELIREGGLAALTMSIVGQLRRTTNAIHSQCYPNGIYTK